MFQSIPHQHLTTSALAVHDHIAPLCLQASISCFLTSALWIHSRLKYGTASSDFYKIPCDIIFQHCNRVSQSKNEEISGQLPYLVEREGERVLPMAEIGILWHPKHLIQDVWHSRRKGKTMYLCQWEEEIQKLDFIEGGSTISSSPSIKIKLLDFFSHWQRYIDFKGMFEFKYKML